MNKLHGRNADVPIYTLFDTKALYKPLVVLVMSQVFAAETAIPFYNYAGA